MTYRECAVPASDGGTWMVKGGGVGDFGRGWCPGCRLLLSLSGTAAPPESDVPPRANSASLRRQGWREVALPRRHFGNAAAPRLRA
eukprot:scaffold123573_cov63-Phaeocystis_antarctica.AAC.2